MSDQDTANDDGDNRMYSKGAGVLAVQTLPRKSEVGATCMSQYEQTLSKQLMCEDLDVSFWAGLLKSRLGIESLQDVGYQLYPFLLQFVRYPKEMKALKRFLRVHVGELFKKEIFFTEWLSLLEEHVETFKRFQREERCRSEHQVQKVEHQLRKMFIVPECAWIIKEASLSDVNYMTKCMFINIRNAVSDNSNLDKQSFIAEKVRGFHLKGIWTTDDPCYVSVRKDVLSLPDDIVIDFPLRSQFSEELQFKSRINEGKFLEHLKIFGCSLLNEQCSGFMLETRDNNEGYCSTVKYCFMPMASGILQSHQLLLSEDALIHLKKIEKALGSDAMLAEKEFKLFLNRFGSHALSGPFHFGGLFIWKCYTIGYEQSVNHDIYQLQKDVIRVSATMHFPMEKRVSDMEGSLIRYPEDIRNRTYVQTFTIGGPPTVVGFLDWKCCLTKCNRTWQLIDHGLSQVAVWDIISRNHKKDFKMSQCLAKEMKQHWVKQNSITTHLNKDQIPSKFIATTVGAKLDRLHCEDFNSLFHYFQIALETYNAEDDGIIHPHKANIVTSSIEKAVSLLRTHFLKTELLMADCLLLTILNPLEYRSEKGRFATSLIRSDIKYLCEKSVGLHEEFLMVQRQNSLLKVQSYLFYLTVFLCDLLGAEERCINFHIEYLKNKLSPLISEISSCLESFQLHSNFNGFQSQMELFYKEDVFVDDKKFIQSPVKMKNEFQSQCKNIMELFTNLGLSEYFPQKMSLHHALKLRDDVILYEKPNLDLKLYPFIMLQKIMMFDPNCRIGFPDDFEDNCECDNFMIHPMDCLLSLLHCSDNFLRQVLLSRLATCNIAVPLLLPHPITKEPTLLLWALRSIVSKQLSHENTPDRLINFPTTFVSFLRIGSPSMSKSEILNSVLNNDRSCNRDIFLTSNSPGVNTSSIMVKGLAEVSWYLSLESMGLFATAVAFVNLHGDACDTDCEKQIKFLSEICTMHIVLLDENVFEDAKREYTLKLLQSLSNAKQLGVSVIIVHKEKKEQIAIHLEELKSEYIFIKYERNVHNLGQRILRRVKKSLKEGSSHLPLANATALAHKCLINTDEDGQDCTWGSELARKVYDMVNNEVIPSEILRLWHEWAEKDKKQHQETTTVVKQENLQMLRQKQFSLAEMNTSVATFLKILKTEFRNRQATWYFILHLKMQLDDLSKLKYPYYIVERELNNSNSYNQNDGLETELKSGENYQLGIEYFLKEIGQIYEAFLEQKYLSMPSINEHKFRCLPRIAAQLLFEGFPIEIYDGDASHVPQKWISAVLNSLSDIINIPNPKIFTLSVLGVQSTGKSTLLNTLFGTQFRVSAGKCTRGASMQLIPVHKLIWLKAHVHYVLIIDTEGLRTPECKRCDNIHQHDNELATFVIGIADLTLITVHGESLGEMKDILLTAAHAFLRMNLVQLKPSCFIIHQNVQQGAAKKLLQGRAQTNKHLDTAAQSAVRETGRITEYANFSDVIAYNYMEDVAFFPSLWNGTQVQVSSEYSKQAQSLKQDLITKYITKVRGSSIVNIKTRLEGLWKYILQEDFVFNFKNAFEIDIYKTVDAQFGEWSWGFKKEMIEWEKTAHYKLMSSTEEELEYILYELTKSLKDDIENLYKKYERLISEFFSANTMMLKWQPSTNLRLEVLRDELKQSARMNFYRLHQVRQDCVFVEKKKENISKCILEKIQYLVNTLEKKLHDNELMQIFEESWNIWLHELTDEIKCWPISDIPFEVKKCLTEYFRADCRVLHQKLENRNLAEWNKLELKVVDYHCHCLLDPQSDLRSELQEHTNQTLKQVEEHLNNLYKKCASTQDFRPQFVTELLHLLKNRKRNGPDSDFTIDYHIDIALTVCRHAIPQFTDIAKMFRKKHDPHEYIEHEVKPCLQRLFVNKYKEVDNEKTFTETLCKELKGAIKDYVFDCLGYLICDEMRENCPWMKTKHGFIGRILLEIGRNLEQESENGFDFCMKFLSDTEESLQFWAKYFTEKHCDSESCLSRMSLGILSDVTSSLIQKAKLVTKGLSNEQQIFTVNAWMRRFHNEVRGKIHVLPLNSLCFLDDQQIINDATFFVKEIENGLTTVYNEFKIEFQTIRYSDIQLEAHEQTAHEILYKEIAGCTEQCPFCKTQCELTNREHLVAAPGSNIIKHRAEHRPQCFGNFRWAQDSTMILHSCPHLVGGFLTFRNDKTNQEWKLYSDYTDHYSEWDIPAKLKHEASIYWKWFIAKYQDKVEIHFQFTKTLIPKEWSAISWSEVEEWLKTEYRLLVA